MADTEEDKPNPERDAWLEEPFTKLALEQVKKQTEPAMLNALLHACSKTTDPGVKGAYARYVAVLNLQIFLATGEIST